MAQDKRNLLLSALKKYRSACDEEARMLKIMISFVESNDDCFERLNSDGFIKGSAILISPDSKKILLTYHKKMDIWTLPLVNEDAWGIFLGGNHNAPSVNNGDVMARNILDIEVRKTPSNLEENEQEQLYYNLTFLIKAEDEKMVINNKSRLRWFTYEDIKSGYYIVSPETMQLADKWHSIGI